MHIKLGYPEEKEEIEIASKDWITKLDELKIILKKEEIIEIQEFFKTMPISEVITKTAVKYIRNTRPETSSISEVKKYVRWGCGPRSAQHLLQAAKVHTLLEGRTSIGEEDIEYLFNDCLRHRIVLNYHANADGVTADDVLNIILKEKN